MPAQQGTVSTYMYRYMVCRGSAVYLRYGCMYPVKMCMYGLVPCHVLYIQRYSRASSLVTHGGTNDNGEGGGAWSYSRLTLNDYSSMQGHAR